MQADLQVVGDTSAREQVIPANRFASTLNIGRINSQQGKRGVPRNP